jgi:hypothetical protein
MNRAIARQSSPIVVSVEQACHAGGRGFESRRSRRSTRPSTRRERPLLGASLRLWVRFGSDRGRIQDPPERGGELGSDVLRVLGLLELVGVDVERDRGSGVPELA